MANISVEPITAPEIPDGPEVPKELEPAPEPEPEPEPEPAEPEPEPEEEAEPVKKRGRPKKEPAPPADKKPRGRPKKQAVPPPSTELPQPSVPSSSSGPPSGPSFSSEDVGRALQELMSAHMEARSKKKKETYSNFHMF